MCAFYSSTSGTPSVRADSSSYRDTSSVVTKLRHRQLPTSSTLALTPLDRLVRLCIRYSTHTPTYPATTATFSDTDSHIRRRGIYPYMTFHYFMKCFNSQLWDGLVLFVSASLSVRVCFVHHTRTTSRRIPRAGRGLPAAFRHSSLCRVKKKTLSKQRTGSLSPRARSI